MRYPKVAHYMCCIAWWRNCITMSAGTQEQGLEDRVQKLGS